MIYKTVYHFMVEYEIEKGEAVYCLDREDKMVLSVNDLSYENALGLIRDAKENDRYEFWVEIKKNDG